MIMPNLTTNPLALPAPGALLRRAQSRNAGPRFWREWKFNEAKKLAGLINKAERATLLDLTLAGDFCAFYRVQMPVPRKPCDGHLNIENEALFRLSYIEDWLSEPPPSWAPLAIVKPCEIFLPNSPPISHPYRGAICLGDLPPGIPPNEIVLMGYSAACIQKFQMDETNPHGVLNMEACDFYRSHTEYMPLTSAGFLEPWQPSQGEQ